ncbi:DUF4169 family protein [Zavarzinia compransoris]|uniref:DUF4169 family protein n=1 Tax=Zavarzinia marina TaxID=2911065 RepID=UPI001F380D41|nr:DUF4169 family protein [Zavarzinia marina]MCF4164314.1 DUF4169 family protein [Zavarzinia marina]
MAEIVNLRRVRKAKARAEAATTAAENRARFGRPAAERKLEAARDALTEKRHEGHRLDRRGEGDDDQG